MAHVMADGTSSFAADEKDFRLPHILSPYHWFYIASSKLGQRASRTFLCCVCFLELLLLAVWIAVFIQYQEIGTVGMFFHSWEWWLAFSIVRALVCMAGIFVIWQRNTDMVRVYFLLYLFNFCLGGFIFTPIFSTSCRCDRFLQCHVLNAFTDEHLINAFAPPDWGWATLLQTPMRVQAYPSRDIPVSKSDALAMAPPQKAVPVSFVELGEDDALHQLLRSNTSHRRSLASTARADAWSDVPQGWTRRHKAALRIISWWKTLPSRQQPVHDRAMLGMFYVSPRQFQWVIPEGEADENVCLDPKVELSLLEAWALQSKLDDLRDAENLGQTGVFDVGREEVVTFLERCFDDRQCGAVRAEVNWSPAGPMLSLCQMVGPLQLRNGLSPDSAKKTYLIEFRKEDRKTETKDKGKPAIYDLNSRQLDATESMERIEGAINRGCFCDPERSGCKASGNADDETFWCWIRPDSVRRCVEKGYAVYKTDRGKGKGDEYWTEDICNPPLSTCQCTKLGMYPRDEYQLKVQTADAAEGGVLWENKMNFGASCDLWRETDKLAWCYVGFDSNCVDKFGRGPSDHYTSELDSKLAGMPLQFKSSLPCNQESQEVAYDHAISHCMLIVYGLVAIFGLECCIRPIMIFMLHTYLAQRCCDKIVVEEQFEVSFSDEGDFVEEDDEGEAAAGETGPAKDAKDAGLDDD